MRLLPHSKEQEATGVYILDGADCWLRTSCKRQLILTPFLWAKQTQNPRFNTRIKDGRCLDSKLRRSIELSMAQKIYREGLTELDKRTNFLLGEEPFEQMD